MKKFLETLLKNTREIFSDIDGDLSSKRVVTFLAFLIMVITWVANVWFDKHVLDYIFEGFLYLVIAGLGVTATEKFAGTVRKVKATIKEIKEDVGREK